VFKGESGDLDGSFADQQEVLSLARVSGDNFVLALTLANLGVDRVAAGEFAAALVYLQDALKVADAHGYQSLSAAIQANLGSAYLMAGDVASGRRLLVAVLDAAQASGEKTHVYRAIFGLAVATCAEDDPAVAATLHGAADNQYEQAGKVFEAIESKMRASDHDRLLAMLGQAAFDAAYQHGRTLSQADAIALALSTAQPDPEPAHAVTDPAVPRAAADGRAGPAGPLSAREREIVALLAGGASNAKIAATLFVTPNTVRTHLDRIRDKTGARNRAELTRYAISAGIEPVVPSP